ncbi:MAG: hypothetical protein R2824_33255 [Saprospiraceae bacterium]
MKKIFLSLTTLLIFLTSTFQILNAQIRTATTSPTARISLPSTAPYVLPFLADDFKPGERVSTGNHAAGIQGLGEDIGVQRYLGNSNWTPYHPGKSGLANTDYLIYNKPVYAMRAGKIVGCWCNAPENPKPGVKHPYMSADNQRIPGGGNMLWVDHADGTRVLYAHMIPGTIPGNLCANKNTIFPKKLGAGESENMYVMLPADKQVTIQQGQYLGRAGNSGSSTAPHLHIHLQKGNQAAPLNFSKGLYLMRPGNKANIAAKWTPLGGSTIPDGEILLWPHRKLSNEYARHAVPAADYQRLFDHLADSGFAPEWIDGYSVGNSVFYNFVWRKSTGDWRAYHGLNSSTYQMMMNKAVADGYSPLQVESIKCGNSVLYAAIFRKGLSGAWSAKHGLTAAQHQANFNSMTASGYRPVSVSVVSINGNPQYTVLYRKANIGSFVLKSSLTSAQYQAEVNANKAAGRQPVYIAAYMHNGTPTFSAIFAQYPGGAWNAKHDQTAAQYQTNFNNATGAGYLTRVVTGYDGAQANHMFASVWRK